MGTISNFGLDREKFLYHTIYVLYIFEDLLKKTNEESQNHFGQFSEYQIKEPLVANT